MSTLSTYAVASTSVNQDFPTSAYQNIGNTFCGYSVDYGGYSYAYRRFDISSIPPTATITSATLYESSYYTSTIGAYDIVYVEAQRCTNITWLETMTWNTQPVANVVGTVTDTISYDTGINDNTGEKFFTVTADVQAALASGGVGWRLRTMFQDSEDDVYGINWQDVSYPRNYPLLVVDYTVPTRRRAHTVLFN